MLVPLLLPRGYSLDEFSWTDWFTRSHENFQMQVWYRLIDNPNKEVKMGQVPSYFYEVKVEFKSFGVTSLRTIAGLANSDSDVAATQFVAGLLVAIRQWLDAGFNLQIVHNAAELLNAMRNMGWAYVDPTLLPDIDAFRRTQDQLVAAQFAHFAVEMSGGVPEPEKLSAYTKWFETVDFNQEIHDDETTVQNGTDDNGDRSEPGNGSEAG